MKRYEPALNFLATATGILSFVWIGFRADLEKHPKSSRQYCVRAHRVRSGRHSRSERHSRN